MTMTIKTRMVAMAGGVVACLGAFFAIQYYAAETVASASRESRRLQQEVATVTDMHLVNTELLLAAMDSIIDRDEGHILPERKATIDRAVSFVRSNSGMVETLARDAGQPALASGFAKSFDAVAKAIQIDLARAIETNAGKDAFAKLDDVIDGDGEAVAQALQSVKEAGRARLAEALNRAEAAVADALMLGIAAFVGGLAILLPLLGLTGRAIVAGIGRVTAVMRRLADGDHTVAVPDVDRRDELGEMSRAVQVFKDNAIENDRLRRARDEESARAEEQRRRDRAAIADSFDSEVGDVVKAIGASVDRLDATARTMSRAAEQTSTQSAAVASASEHAAANVQTVASAAEQLSSSIREIAQHVGRSSDMAKDAVGEARKASAQVQGLSDAADEIGGVVSLIQDVAEQTNLLALNATIEAARAGEAGKGFAVVAQEVKQLASQTAKATDEISSRIARVQGETVEAVTAIGRIASAIETIEQTASSIAAAVEEQGVATEEITRNVREAANGTQDVTDKIAVVSQAADENGRSARDLLTAAGDLTGQSDRLQAQGTAFLSRMREA